MWNLWTDINIQRVISHQLPLLLIIHDDTAKQSPARSKSEPTLLGTQKLQSTFTWCCTTAKQLPMINSVWNLRGWKVGKQCYFIWMIKWTLLITSLSVIQTMKPSRSTAGTAGNVAWIPARSAKKYQTGRETRTTFHIWMRWALTSPPTSLPILSHNQALYLKNHNFSGLHQISVTDNQENCLFLWKVSHCCVTEMEKN